MGSFQPLYSRKKWSRSSIRKLPSSCSSISLKSACISRTVMLTPRNSYLKKRKVNTPRYCRVRSRLVRRSTRSSTPSPCFWRRRESSSEQWESGSESLRLAFSSSFEEVWRSRGLVSRDSTRLMPGSSMDETSRDDSLSFSLLSLSQLYSISRPSWQRQLQRAAAQQSFIGLALLAMICRTWSSCSRSSLATLTPKPSTSESSPSSTSQLALCTLQLRSTFIKVAWSILPQSDQSNSRSTSIAFLTPSVRFKYDKKVRLSAQRWYLRSAKAKRRQRGRLAATAISWVVLRRSCLPLRVAGFLRARMGRVSTAGRGRKDCALRLRRTAYRSALVWAILVALSLSRRMSCRQSSTVFSLVLPVFKPDSSLIINMSTDLICTACGLALPTAPLMDTHQIVHPPHLRRFTSAKPQAVLPPSPPYSQSVVFASQPTCYPCQPSAWSYRFPAPQPQHNVLPAPVTQPIRQILPSFQQVHQILPPPQQQPIHQILPLTQSQPTTLYDISPSKTASFPSPKYRTVVRQSGQKPCVEYKVVVQGKQPSTLTLEKEQFTVEEVSTTYRISRCQVDEASSIIHQTALTPDMHFRAAEAIPLQQAPPDSSLLRAQPPDTTLPLESRPPSRPPSIPDLDLEPIVEFAREQKQFPITKANSIFVEQSEQRKQNRKPIFAEEQPTGLVLREHRGGECSHCGKEAQYIAQVTLNRKLGDALFCDPCIEQVNSDKTHNFMGCKHCYREFTGQSDKKHWRQKCLQCGGKPIAVVTPTVQEEHVGGETLDMSCGHCLNQVQQHLSRVHAPRDCLFCQRNITPEIMLEFWARNTEIENYVQEEESQAGLVSVSRLRKGRDANSQLRELFGVAFESEHERAPTEAETQRMMRQAGTLLMEDPGRSLDLNELARGCK